MPRAVVAIGMMYIMAVIVVATFVTETVVQLVLVVFGGIAYLQLIMLAGRLRDYTCDLIPGEEHVT